MHNLVCKKKQNKITEFYIHDIGLRLSLTQSHTNIELYTGHGRSGSSFPRSQPWRAKGWIRGTNDQARGGSLVLTLAGVLRSLAGVGIPHTTLCHMLTTVGGSLGPGQLRLSQDFPACSCQYPLISRLRVLALVMCGMAGGREGPPCYDQHHSTVVLCSVVQQLCICMVHGLGWIGSPCILNWGPRSHTHAWPFWLKRVCVRAVGSPWLLLLSRPALRYPTRDATGSGEEVRVSVRGFAAAHDPVVTQLGMR